MNEELIVLWRRGLGCDYDKRNISVVNCETNIRITAILLQGNQNINAASWYVFGTKLEGSAHNFETSYK